MRKARKEGYEIAKELSNIDLSKFNCSHRCYDCIYWGSGYCQANVIKRIVERSNEYVKNHKE